MPEPGEQGRNYVFERHTGLESRGNVAVESQSAFQTLTYTQSCLPALPTRPGRGSAPQGRKRRPQLLGSARLLGLTHIRTLTASSQGTLPHPLAPPGEGSAGLLHLAVLLPKPRGQGRPLSAREPMVERQQGRCAWV